MDSEVSQNIIPFYLVTGFLGSGKTTLLKEILKCYSAERRIAVIQNEFAPSGIDGRELEMSASGFRLVEINNGSVFCVCLMATFVESVKDIIEEYKPEMIFLEASGLSDPVNIIELLGRDGLNGTVDLANVITIVDAPNFERGLKTLPGFRHQIMLADTVLINKSDIFGGSMTLLHDQIRAMNPFAGIIETTWCKTDLKGIILPGESISRVPDPGSEYPEVVTTDRKSPDSHPPADISGEGGGISGKEQKVAFAFTGKKPGGRPDINVCVLRAHQKLPPGALRSFLKELQELSPRIKGFVNMENGDVIAVQTVFEQFEISQVLGYEGPTELIAFGRGLTPRHLRDMFRKHTNPANISG